MGLITHSQCCDVYRDEFDILPSVNIIDDAVIVRGLVVKPQW